MSLTPVMSVSLGWPLCLPATLRPGVCGLEVDFEHQFYGARHLSFLSWQVICGPYFLAVLTEEASERLWLADDMCLVTMPVC